MKSTGCFQKCINLKNVKFPRRVGLMSYDMFEAASISQK